MSDNAKQFHYEEDKSAAMELAKKLNNVTLHFTVKAGDNGKIFGSITGAEIAEELKKDGYEISKKQIVLDSPIKYAGVYKVTVKLFVGISAKISVEVKVL